MNDPRAPLALILVALAGLPAVPEEKASLPGEQAKFPLRFGREYRYTWVLKNTKVGETRMRITEVDAPAGSAHKKYFRSSSSFRYEREGQFQSGEQDCFFDPTWRPLQYETHQRYSGLGDRRSFQEQKGQIRGGRLEYKVIHNGATNQPVHSEMEAPADAYLFLNQSVDSWAILAANLLRRPSTYEAKVMYPDFLRVYEVTFSFEKEEPVAIGKDEKPIGRLFLFQSKERQIAGKVWVDNEGRLLQYEQGDLLITLAE